MTRTASFSTPATRSSRSTGKQGVRSAAGECLGYDRLLLATGSKPIALPVPGLTLPGVCAFRDIADVEVMTLAAHRHRRAVVIGGGLLGLEAAWGLKRRGMAVTIVHLMPILMERQLDATAAGLLQRDLARRGIEFLTNAQTEEILGTDAEGVRLADGREIAGDIVMAIGTRQYRSGVPPGSTSIAATSSATICAPAIRQSTRSASASSTTGRFSGWLRPYGSRRGFAPPVSRAISMPPISRRRSSPA
jgi:pyruvate/2-oxoglutarate dehydrogenase complex dihydrolipoamide dehydrogenase (E3) component